jgi:hypothetical protein
MDYLVDARGSDFEVVNNDWKEEIKQMFLLGNKYALYDKIWEMSLYAFDKPREVQVVIDANMKLYISVGNGGLVTFGGQDKQTSGMKFPINEWIHTHPFGSAYFSGTDMNTIFMYQRHMLKATVLGNSERAEYLFKADVDGTDRIEYIKFKKENEEEL